MVGFNPFIWWWPPPCFMDFTDKRTVPYPTWLRWYRPWSNSFDLICIYYIHRISISISIIYIYTSIAENMALSKKSLKLEICCQKSTFQLKDILNLSVPTLSLSIYIGVSTVWTSSRTISTCACSHRGTQTGKHLQDAWISTDGSPDGSRGGSPGEAVVVVEGAWSNRQKTQRGYHGYHGYDML